MLVPSRADIAKYTAIALIISVLIQRYFSLGGWITFSVILCYLIIDCKRFYKGIRNFKVSSQIEKVMTVIFATFMFIEIDFLVNNKSSYFVMLVLLAIEFMLYSKKKISNE